MPSSDPDSRNGVSGEHARRRSSAKTRNIGLRETRGHRKGQVADDPLAPLRELCALMAHDLRQGVLIALAKQPMEVTHLADGLGTSVTWLSHNLKRLLESGLVNATRSGRTRIYSLGPGALVTRKGTKVVLDLTACDGSHLSITKHAPPSSRPPHAASRLG